MRIFLVLSTVILILSHLQCARKSSQVVPTKPKQNNTAKEDPKKSTKMHFVDKILLSEVLKIAVEKQKLVFVDVNAKWCTPCKMMKKDVYSHDATADFFNRNFVNHYVDIEMDEGPDIKLIYDIHELPTLLILDGKGRVVDKHSGALYHKDLLLFAESAIDKYRQQN
ncbi:MAG: thioredoxin family protein [Saprospiraceae bacterium]